MKDVASLANVSIATVSRYLNGELNRMSTQTAATIKEAITKLNYVPNSAARQMVTHSSKIVAVAVANIDDYFSTELFKGANSILESHHYTGVLFDSDSDNQRENELLNSINQNNFDGLILQPLTDTADTIRQQVKRDIPIVVADRELEKSSWPEVITDNYASAQRAATYFYRAGFTRVIVLSSDVSAASTRRERFHGIQDVFEKIDVINIPEESYQRQQVKAELMQLISKTNEKTLLFALKERWLLEFIAPLFVSKVVDPQQFQVTAFADTRLAHTLTPEIKLIHQNPFLIGASCAEILIEILNGNGTQVRGKNIVPAEFDWRD